MSYEAEQAWEQYSAYCRNLLSGNQNSTRRLSFCAGYEAACAAKDEQIRRLERERDGLAEQVRRRMAMIRDMAQLLCWGHEGPYNESPREYGDLKREWVTLMHEPLSHAETTVTLMRAVVDAARNVRANIYPDRNGIPALDDALRALDLHTSQPSEPTKGTSNEQR